ncbi:MAG: hypothetical protein CMG00_05055 [Candidatus Marinimicrobia bacterium]|nr:hypothetical protein [Candidatus Neomarinimicrobiota bacterium]|tara:strand:+ start:1383 stop:2111 length:729 start_codon:yes stop_codon:yes gene_type:complete
MKKINAIISILSILSFTVALNTKGMAFNDDSKLSIYSSEDVYGIQFDLRFDHSIISVDDLSNSNSLVNGVNLFSRVKAPGFVRVVMFSDELNKISSANQFLEIAELNVVLLDNYAQSSTITFDNILLANRVGQQLDYPGSFIYEVSSQTPNEFGLSSAYPNPFNPSTNIDYSVSVDSDVSLFVYDMQGRLVKTLVSEYKIADQYTVSWNGKNDNGEQVASGMYLVRLESNGDIAQQAITLLK